MITFACLRKRRKPSSSGRRMRRAWPLPLMPRAVLPTLWMYSCGFKVEDDLNQGLSSYLNHFKRTYTVHNKQQALSTLGSSGGSYWTIQSTSGMSRPRAATSVHSRMPESALQNWKKVVVRLVCFCLPWDTGGEREKHLSAALLHLLQARLAAAGRRRLREWP